MKTNRPTVILALSTILIGALLITFPANATKWLVMAIGALFLIPGIVSVVSYIIQRKHNPDVTEPNKENGKNKPSSFPFVGIGSILFGSVLLAAPNIFLSALLYLLGAFLVLAGLVQAYRLSRFHKQYNINAVNYIISVLISIAGIVVIVLNYKIGAPIPTVPANEPHGELPSFIFGITSVVYGLTEIIYAIQFRKSKQPNNVISTQSNDVTIDNTAKNTSIIDAEIIDEGK
ncbi:MAG: DUF308 domain-containing protein [Prevotellaceae bacterium]|nr:DUF308 domain-containing protein [Prevotellaceae bacterium]